MANLLQGVRLTAAALLLCAGLCGCIVDGGTGEVKGPVYVTSMLAAGAALSRPAAKPPTEWSRRSLAACASSSSAGSLAAWRTGFEVRPSPI